MKFGDVLCEPNEVFKYAWFPLTGYISLMMPLAGHEPLELGMIGNEGMLGAMMMLGTELAPMRGMVQGAGAGLRMPAATFRKRVGSTPALHRLIGVALNLQFHQLAQTAACNAFHELEPRLARWLLMSQDRSHTATLQLTHQFLADMLGVQRSAVTIAAGSLQSRGLISYSRGKVLIVSRTGLEGASCACFTPLTH